MKKHVLIAAVVAGTLVLGGCSGKKQESKSGEAAVETEAGNKTSSADEEAVTESGEAGEEKTALQARIRQEKERDSQILHHPVAFKAFGGTIPREVYGKRGPSVAGFKQGKEFLPGPVLILFPAGCKHCRSQT